MATLVFGFAGAAIGGLFGNPVLGWAVGTQVGVLFGPRSKPQERGRVDDIRLSGSSYGVMIPRVYGQGKVGGNIIWLDPRGVRETSSTERVGNKKSGRQTIRSYSYHATFTVLFCATPIDAEKTIRRIWADDQLIYTLEKAPPSDYDVRVHMGRAGETPEPVVAALMDTPADSMNLAVLRTPAYFGGVTATLVDMLLNDSGNRIPNLAAELACPEVGTPGPFDLAIYWPFDEDVTQGFSYLSDWAGEGIDLTTGWTDLAFTGIHSTVTSVLGGANEKALSTLVTTGDAGSHESAVNPAARLGQDQILAGGAYGELASNTFSVLFFWRFMGATLGTGAFQFGFWGGNGARWTVVLDSYPLHRLVVASNTTPNAIGETPGPWGWEIVTTGVDYELEKEPQNRRWQLAAFTFTPYANGTPGRARLYLSDAFGNAFLAKEEAQYRTGLGLGSPLTDAQGTYWKLGFYGTEPFWVDEVGYTNHEVTEDEIQLYLDNLGARGL